jgi:hypothetical protein
MKIDPDEKDIAIEKDFFSMEIPVEARAGAYNNLFFNMQANWRDHHSLYRTLYDRKICLPLSYPWT